MLRKLQHTETGKLALYVLLMLIGVENNVYLKSNIEELRVETMVELCSSCTYTSIGKYL